MGAGPKIPDMQLEIWLGDGEEEIYHWSVVSPRKRVAVIRAAGLHRLLGETSKRSRRPSTTGTANMASSPSSRRSPSRQSKRQENDG